jgi:hypothetical protein
MRVAVSEPSLIRNLSSVLLLFLRQMDLAHVITQHMISIMSNVLSSFDTVPSVLLDEILRHFTPSGMKENEGGTRLAIQLLQTNRDRLERPICTWLHSLLVAGEDPADVGTSITEHEDHVSILAQLSIHANPVLEMFLQKDAIDLITHPDEGVREEFTDVFSKTFSSKNVSAENVTVMSTNQPLFEYFLERFMDKAPRIRLLIAKAIGAILIRQQLHQANKEEILNHIADSVEDKDEGVRIATIQSIREAGVTNAESIPVRLISAVTCRAMDRKSQVRLAAVQCLADLFAEHVAPFWRSLAASPKSINQYLVIPRKLAQITRVDTFMMLTVDVLYDDRILGADESIEARTKALIGLFLSLYEKPAAGAVVPTKRSILAEVDDSSQPETDPHEARKMFSEKLLGFKAQLHRIVNDLVKLHGDLAAASKAGATDKVEVMERQKNAMLANLARRIHVDQDGPSLDDLIQVLHLIFFEAKDKNIHKYLKALADPMTEYQQIRIAQKSLIACVKAMGVPKKKVRLTR